MASAILPLSSPTSDNDKNNGGNTSECFPSESRNEEPLSSSLVISEATPRSRGVPWIARSAMASRNETPLAKQKRSDRHNSIKSAIDSLRLKNRLKRGRTSDSFCCEEMTIDMEPSSQA